jgi:B-cell receptor-associated protein 31
MIQLLFLVLFTEAAVAFLLAIKVGPLRDLAMKGVDGVKSGRGPATVKTLACTMTVILASSVYSLLRIQAKGARLGGNVSPMDQVLWRTHLLEATLIGNDLSAFRVISYFWWGICTIIKHFYSTRKKKISFG